MHANRPNPAASAKTSRKRGVRFTTALCAVLGAAITTAIAHADTNDHPHALRDPFTSSCYSDRVAVSTSLLTQPDGFVSGTLTLMYSPSCGVNWLEMQVKPGYGLDRPTLPGGDISVTMFITQSDADGEPKENAIFERSDVRKDVPPSDDGGVLPGGPTLLTNDFRSMMIPAPGHECVTFSAGIVEFEPWPMQLPDGTTADGMEMWSLGHVDTTTVC